ncbi:CCAAT/enhancer-binding protein zeta [Hondaea fermentalgiana]|uniref:CCAAT/enhancer-binding protein zeta n=1 Tax=Hondaea fermentalgiana TaxID=2315210 RepID=A0A2R5GGF8_9STRA|nr:CCAAT/enhancer-binding protein zeta [Hondaea fermentalgiana]|eukprot:GBG26934.1 CCAAT/enhancer-binding protein zeta [Hondaea fermentalgiana]
MAKSKGAKGAKAKGAMSKKNSSKATDADDNLHADIQAMLKDLELPAASADNVAKAAAARAARAGKKDQEPEYEGDSSDDDEAPDGMAEAYGDLDDEDDDNDVDDDDEEEKDEDSSDDEPKPLGKTSTSHTVFSDDDDDDDDDDEDEDEEEEEGGEQNGGPEDEPGSLWFEDAAERLAPLDLEREADLEAMDTSSRTKLKREKYEAIGELRTRAETLVQKRAAALAAQRRNDPDSQWMRKVMHSGTVSDKVAAMALSVSSAPPEQLDTLQSLVNMASSKGRREAELAIDALADLFINNLLPSDRPLRSFNENIESLSAKGRKAVTASHLEYWMIEGEIKARFLQYVRSLEQWSFDTVEHTKRKAVTTACRLLREKPEQEQMLLMLIVNKLGDSTKRLASHVVFLLGQLLDAHPNMRAVVATEVEQFLFRPRTPARGIYYGAVFLNQIVLQRNNDEALAQKLINIYIRLFKHTMGMDTLGETDEPAQIVVTSAKKGKKRGRKGKSHHKSKNKAKQNAAADPTLEVSVEEIKSRLLSAILTGVNRAFPYANSQGADFEEQIDTLFKMVHVSSFATATQALMLLLQIMLARNALSDRFFRTLYAKLYSDELRSSSKQTMFLNVLFRAIKSDVVLPRIRAFVKRMLQVAANSSAPFAAGVLVLVSAIARQRPALRDMIFGSDANVSANGDAQPEAEVEAGTSARDGAKPKTTENEDEEDEDEDEDEESIAAMTPMPKLLVVNDGDDDDDEGSSEEEKEKTAQDQDGKAHIAVDEDSGGNEYDIAKREPRFAGCSKTCLLWEIQVFSRHYHPSVRKFAQDLIRDPGCLAYEGDPLRDFSGTAFLDRFVYRNPRQRDIDTLKSKDTKHTFGMHGRIARLGRKATQPSVNSAKFLLKSEEEIPEEDRFFHQYFHRQAKLENRDLRSDLYEKMNSDKGESVDPGDDSEEEMDAFADKLADKLMQDTFGKADVDGDMDLDLDYSEDEDDEKTSAAKPKLSSEAALFGDADSDDDDEEMENAALDGEMSDDDDDDDEDDDDDDLMDAGDSSFAFAGSDDDDEDDDDSDEDDNERPSKRNKAAASFADADAFAQLLETDNGSAKEKKWLQKQEASSFAESRRRAMGRGGSSGGRGRGRGRGKPRGGRGRR